MKLVHQWSPIARERLDQCIDGGNRAPEHVGH